MLHAEVRELVATARELSRVMGRLADVAACLGQLPPAVLLDVRLTAQAHEDLIGAMRALVAGTERTLRSAGGTG